MSVMMHFSNKFAAAAVCWAVVTSGVSAESLEKKVFDGLIGAWADAEPSGRIADGWFDLDCSKGLYLSEVDESALASPFVGAFGKEFKSVGAVVFFRGGDGETKAVVADGVEGLTESRGAIVDVTISNVNRSTGTATLSYSDRKQSYTLALLAEDHFRLVPPENTKGGFGGQTDKDYARCPTP